MRLMTVHLAPTTIPYIPPGLRHRKPDIQDYSRLWVFNVLFTPRTGIYPSLFISVSRSIQLPDWFEYEQDCNETMHGKRRSNGSWNIDIVQWLRCLCCLVYRSVRETKCQSENSHAGVTAGAARVSVDEEVKTIATT